jgi:nicotinamidase-related amidase
MYVRKDGICQMGTAANPWLVTPTEVDMSRPPRPVRKLTIEADPQRIAVDATKSALLIVDMQNDFCSPGGWLDGVGVDYTPDRAPILPLSQLVPAFRQHGIPVIWVNWGVRPDLLNISPTLLHAHSPDGIRVGLGEKTATTGAKVLEKGGWGAAIVDELHPNEQDIHVTKHRFSGFWDTDLDSILRNLGITTLFMGGVNADQCVLTTLQDAHFLGYDTILVQDCTATTSPDYCLQATFYNVKLLFGFLTQSENLLTALTQLSV